jgi:voltage-gated potassium channel
MRLKNLNKIKTYICNSNTIIAKKIKPFGKNFASIPSYFRKPLIPCKVIPMIALNKTIALKNSDLNTHSKNPRSKALYFTKARRFVERGGWRFELYKFLYRSKSFSMVLFGLILLSSLAVILQTVEELDKAYTLGFQTIEWVLTITFTVEYFLRIVASPVPKRYVLSWFGLLDFWAFCPFYLSLLNLGNVNFLLVLRLIRLFRLLRMFDLVEYSYYKHELTLLVQALRNSRRKISIFLLTVFVAVTILGSLMFVIEGKANGFVSIPKGIYWAVVTISTVGYGDVTPKTPLGQLIASALMLMGFSTIVVFTSIVGAEIYKQSDEKKEILAHKSCLDCGMGGHDSDASYCKHCGSRLWDAD